MNEIKEVRMRMHESQEDFAKRFGVTWRTVQNWEAGKPMHARHRRKFDAIIAKLENEQELEPQPQQGNEWYIEVIASQQRTIEMLTARLSAKM